MRPGATFSRRSALAALAGLVVAACTRDEEALDPVWGKEPCAHCKMLVSDKRHAAQIVEVGERRWFDDVGCMVAWLEAHGGREAPVRAWVRDAAATGWLDARAARYASGARTPMDSGFEAAAEGGIGFEAMREAVMARKRSTR